MINKSDVEKEIDLILWSAQLKEVYRYQKQRFWEQETAEHEQALQCYSNHSPTEKLPTCENDAAHSWHMADMAITIGPHFPDLDIGRCVMLAIIHDKLEIITDDADPLGKSGDGKDTHAFNADMKALKRERELKAFEEYQAKLSAATRPLQQGLFEEERALDTQESKFIKALDRLQPLTYILKRKNGNMHDDHIAFTINYTSMCKEFFPGIAPYHDELTHRMLTAVANHRDTTLSALKQQLNLG